MFKLFSNSNYGTLKMTIGDLVIIKNGKNISINGFNYDADVVPEDIEFKSSDFQEYYWMLCSDIARSSEEYKVYTDKILKSYGVNLDKVEGLTKSAELEIRQKAKDIGKIVKTLKDNLNINYFNLAKKTVSNLNVYTLNIDEIDVNNQNFIAHIVEDISSDSNNLKNNVVLIRKATSAYAIVPTKDGYPKLLSIPDNTEISVNILNSVKGDKDTIRKIDYPQHLTKVLCELSSMAGNEYYRSENINMLNSDVVKMINTIEGLGYKNSFAKFMQMDTNIFKKVASYSSNCKLTTEFFKLLSQDNVGDIFKIITGAKSSTFKYIIQYESYFENFKKIVKSLDKNNYSNPGKVVFETELKSLKAMIQYDSYCDNFIEILESMHKLGYKNSYYSLTSDLNTIKEAFKYEDNTKYTKILVQSLHKHGCTDPWGVITALPTSTFKNIVYSKDKFYKKYFYNMPKHLLGSKKYLDLIPITAWSDHIQGKIQLNNILTLFNELVSYEIELPSYFEGLKFEYLEILAKKPSETRELLRLLSSKFESPLKALIDLGPSGFKIALNNSPKLIEKIKSGADILGLIKNCWDYEDKPIANMFTSIKYYKDFTLSSKEIVESQVLNKDSKIIIK